jgi:ornithine cyclodeaminase
VELDRSRATPLSDAAVVDLLDVRSAIEAVRGVCLDLAADRLEVPPRLSLAGGQVLVMPARHRELESAVTKVVSVGVPGAARVNGLVTWTSADGATRPLASAAAFTALRTAAVTAVAVDHLASRAAASLVVFGAGVQARAHVTALLAVRPVASVVIAGRDPDRTTATTRELASAHPGVEFSCTASVKTALADADLVCCATTATEPLLDTRQLPSTAFVAAVGSHERGVRELPRSLVATAAVVVVDDVNACLVESGEVIDAVESGSLPLNRLIGLPHVVSQGWSAQTDQRIVFKSVGTAAYDWAIAHLLAERVGLTPEGALARPA